MELNGLRQIRMFVVVAEARSFSQASRQLFISQPAVSKQMKDLEDQVGVKLFERGRKLTLTEEGQAFLRHARPVLASVERLESAMESTGPLRGHLEIGASTVWEYVLPRTAVTFQRDNPDVTMTLRIGNTEQIVRFVAEREVRLGFVGALPNARDIEALPAGEEELILIGPPGHPLAHGRPVRPLELQGMPFVQRESDSATAQFATHHLRGLGLEPRILMELGSNEAMKVAVRQGIGLGMISQHAVEAELSAGTLSQVLLDAPPCLRSLYALRNAMRSPTAVEAAFLAAAGAAFPSTDRSKG